MKLGFIFGVPRSGTTLVSSIINRHPLSFVTPETHFFNIFTEDKEKELLENPNEALKNYYQILDRIRGDNHRTWAPTENEIIQQCNSDYTLRSVFVSICRILSKESQKQLIFEKTPGHLMHAEKIRKLFPDAPFINVIRDGRDVAESLVKVQWASDNYLENVLRWKLQIIKGGELLGNDANTINVKYEDLVSDPATSSKNISAFLKIDYHQSTLAPDGSESRLIESNSKHKNNILQPIDVKNAGKWKKKLSKKAKIACNIIASEELNIHNYETWNTNKKLVIKPNLLNKIITESTAEDILNMIYDRYGELSYTFNKNTFESIPSNKSIYFTDEIIGITTNNNLDYTGITLTLIRNTKLLVSLKKNKNLVLMIHDDSFLGNNWMLKHILFKVMIFTSSVVIFYCENEKTKTKITRELGGNLQKIKFVLYGDIHK